MRKDSQIAHCHDFVCFSQNVSVYVSPCVCLRVPVCVCVSPTTGLPCAEDEDEQKSVKTRKGTPKPQEHARHEPDFLVPGGGCGERDSLA